MTITTDWGIKDSYVANFKGLIYKNFNLNQIKIIDITHNINPFDIQEAYYVIKNSFIFFPDNTIHFIGVDNNFFFYQKYIILLYQNHYFISCDNGLLSLLYQGTIPQKIIEVKIDFNKSIISFQDIFVNILNYIFNNTNNTNNIIINVVKYLPDKIRIIHPRVELTNKLIIGNIIYIDNYGNAITDITRNLFYQYVKNNKFKFIVNKYSFNKIYNYYSELVVNKSREIEYHGEAFIVFNIFHYIEICIYKSNLNTVIGASTLLGITKKDVVYIEF